MSVTYSPKIVSDNLLLNYDPGNPKSYPGSGTHVNDLSGNGNHGTLVNGVSPITSSKLGYFNFDGTDDYINCGSGVQLSNNFTLSIWLLNPNGGFLIDQGNIGNDPTGCLEWFGSTLQFNNLTTGVSANFAYSVLQNGQWNNVVTTFSSRTTGFFINGQLDSYKFTGTTTFTPTGILKIGRRAFSTSSIYSGGIGPVMIYNRPLTPAEVLQNYNAVKTRF